MGTRVRYNGVTLDNVITRQWNQEVKYDDSHTDAMYHVFSLAFEGILHDGYEGTSVASVAVLGEAPSMSHQYDAVHRRLLTPRQNLVVEVVDAPMSGDSPSPMVLFRCDGAPDISDTSSTAAMALTSAFRDVDNGPKPKSFRVLQVIGSKVLRVAFEIECSKLVCANPMTSSGSLAPGIPNVLSNRWAVQESMDENQFLTRTINGKIRYSAAMASIGHLVDPKYMVVPALEIGFRRATIDFSVDATGLECDYQITDRQVYAAAPWPATKMQARHSQSTAEGLNMVSEVHVMLEGPPFASKKHLLARAIQVIDAKLNFGKMTQRTGNYAKYIPQHIAFTDFIGDVNRVEAVARFLEIPGDGNENINAMLANLGRQMGKPLELPSTAGEPWEYDPSISSPPSYYGYHPPQGKDTTGGVRSKALAMMFQCYLQQPCVDVHAIRKGVPISGSNTPPKDPEKPKKPDANQFPPGSLPSPPDNLGWADAAKVAVHTYSRMSSRYEVDMCRVQLPIG